MSYSASLVPRPFSRRLGTRLILCLFKFMNLHFAVSYAKQALIWQLSYARVYAEVVWHARLLLSLEVRVFAVEFYRSHMHEPVRICTEASSREETRFRGGEPCNLILTSKSRDSLYKRQSSACGKKATNTSAVAFLLLVACDRRACYSCCEG